MTQPSSRVGTAGWAIPRDLVGEFPAAGSHLERYAARFDAVEINSSFYRPHRRATYARWAASVPAEFRFAVKLPKTITHERRLRGCRDLLDCFGGEIDGLGEKRGPVLIQLPPSLTFDPALAGGFLREAVAALGGPLVCEPRHPSWFRGQADALLAGAGVARVAADPAVTPEAAEPGGGRGLAYFRLHGSPRIYHSDYSTDAIDRHAARVRSLLKEDRTIWTIFDNTAEGHAQANALALENLISGASSEETS